MPSEPPMLPIRSVSNRQVLSKGEYGAVTIEDLQGDKLRLVWTQPQLEALILEFESLVREMVEERRRNGKPDPAHTRTARIPDKLKIEVEPLKELAFLTLQFVGGASTTLALNSESIRSLVGYLEEGRRMLEHDTPRPS